MRVRSFLRCLWAVSGGCRRSRLAVLIFSVDHEVANPSVGAASLIRKFLAGQGSRINQAALGDGEYRHSVIVNAVGDRVALAAAGARSDAAGTHTRIGGGGDGDCFCPG